MLEIYNYTNIEHMFYKKGKKLDKDFTNLDILNMQEADRQRIARDLHDTSLQNLAHLVHKIELCGAYLDEDPLRAKLELAVIKKNLKSVIEEIRGTIYDLRPMEFDDLGLKVAFERLIDTINEDKAYELDINIEDVSCDNSLIMVTVYRVVQECLFNIKKHSHANKIIFHCKEHGKLFIIDIEDNGKGFEPESIDDKKEKHFGISVMNERVNLLNGNIHISSIIDEGTKVHIEIPFR